MIAPARPSFLAKLYSPRPLLQALHAGAIAVTSIVATSMFFPGFMGAQFNGDHWAKIALTIGIISYIQIRQKPRTAVWWYALGAAAPIIISLMTAPRSADARVLQLATIYLFASVLLPFECEVWRWRDRK